MTPQLIYQRWLEYDPPESCAHIPPTASWVLPLPNSSALLTLLYRPLTTPTSPPRTRILHLSPTGDATVWPPAATYPAPVMFYAHNNELFGLDLTLPGKVYVCRLDGSHIASLPIDLRMATLLAPQSLRRINNRLHWTTKSGQHFSAQFSNGMLTDQLPEPVPPPPVPEIHFPHTHLCSDSCLYLLDHDPMSRITKYQL